MFVERLRDVLTLAVTFTGRCRFTFHANGRAADEMNVNDDFSKLL